MPRPPSERQRGRKHATTAERRQAYRETQRRYEGRRSAEQRAERLAHKREMERLRQQIVDARLRLMAATDAAERAALEGRITRVELEQIARRSLNPGGKHKKGA